MGLLSRIGRKAADLATPENLLLAGLGTGAAAGAAATFGRDDGERQARVMAVANQIYRSGEAGTWEEALYLAAQMIDEEGASRDEPR